MKLHGSTTSPFARKVMIVAAECGVSDRIQPVPRRVSAHAPDRDYAALNPLMKIPALERDDGSILYDSIVICEVLDAMGRSHVFPPAGEARWDALRRHALADGILEAAVLIRNETSMRPEALRWQAWIDGQQAKIDQGLDAAERDVPRVAAFDIGQIGIVCALGYLDFRFPSQPWRPGRPALAAWLEAVSARPSVRETAPSA